LCFVSIFGVAFLASLPERPQVRNRQATIMSETNVHPKLIRTTFVKVKKQHTATAA
jgi:hypothetical protein